MKDLHDYNLKGHNTFGMDVKCRRFIEFSTVEELQHIVKSLIAADAPLLFLGGGSNVLFTKDYDGTILHSAIKGHHATRMDGSVYLRCGSGEVWDDVVRLCVENGMYGAENLSLIPGEVGASAVQNIGAYGVEAKDIIDKDYKNFTAEMYSKGHSFFTYISDNPDGLASCCFDGSQKVLCKSSNGGLYYGTFEQLSKIKTRDRKNFTVFHNSYPPFLFGLYKER